MKTTSCLLLIFAFGCGTDSVDHGDDLKGADAGIGENLPIENTATACPHIDLGKQVPVQWKGSTAGLPNHVESSRLEWGDAPDDSLLFTAPDDGSYMIYLESTSGNGGVGASVRDFDEASFYTAEDCPSSGQIKLIDGIYGNNQPEYPHELKAGQSILIWVSTTIWADTDTAEYTLRVDKVGAAAQKKVFVTSETSGGNLGGLSGADATCQQHAANAGLGGTWVAWLSSSTSHAIDRLTGDGPWVRLDGEPVFANKAAIADQFGKPDNGLWLDESGTWLPSDRIWTGTGIGGRFAESIGDSCQGWTSNAMADQARIGQVGRSNGAAWTSFSFTTCDQSGTRLICFEL